VDTVAYHFSETLNSYHLNGRKVTYSVQIKMNPCCKKMPSIRQNPHRLQLGNIGLEITMKNGQLAGINDIENIQHSLNMWTGEINSRFTVEGVPVEVIIYGHQQDDAIAVKIKLALGSQRPAQLTDRLTLCRLRLEGCGYKLG